MPVKLNIGLSRKVGEANFGSRGASVNLEVELDSGIVSDQQRFQERVRGSFTLKRARSINAELDLPSEGPAIEQPVPPTEWTRIATQWQWQWQWQWEPSGRRLGNPEPGQGHLRHCSA